MSMFEDQLLLLEKRKKLLDANNYNIVYMGDSWFGDKGYTSNEIFTAALEAAEEFNPLFVLHGGDIVYNGTRDNFQFFLDNKKNISSNLPFFTVVGNHEMVRDLTGDAAVANFKEMIGPLHFVLNIPEYHLTIIALDSLYHHEYHNYGLTRDELLYLRDNLRQCHRNTLVAMHVPPETDKWVPEPEDDTFFTKGSKVFFDEVSGRISAALLSHIHTFKKTEYEDTKLYISGGGGAALLTNAIFHILVINIRNHNSCSKISFKVVPIGRD